MNSVVIEQTSTGGRQVLRVFDPVDVFSRDVRGRTVVYLDTSVWAALADSRTDEARRCARSCEAAFDSGRVLFPLSFASISELFEHPSSSERRAQAILMDRLSAGVSFRSRRKVYDVEVVAVAARMLGCQLPAQREHLFTYVLEYLGDARTTFQPFWKEADIIAYVEYLRAHPASRSVAWWASQDETLAKIRGQHAASKAEFVARFGAHLAASRHHFLNPDGSLNRKRALREEYLAVAKDELVPRLRNMLLAVLGGRVPDALRTYVHRNGEGSEARLVELLGLMPALKMFCEVMAARTMNPARAVRPQDFWDAEHASIGCAHAEAFVTLDRGLVDLVLRRCETTRSRACRVLGGLVPLTEYLHTLAAAS